MFIACALLSKKKKKKEEVKKEKENQNERVGGKNKQSRNAIPYSTMQRVNDVYIKNNSSEIFYPGDNI